MREPSVHRLLMMMALVMTLGASALNIAQAATSTSNLTQASQTRQAQEAEQLAQNGNPLEAAKRYEALAAQNSGLLRDRLLLKAAFNAQLGEDIDMTQRLLDLTSKSLPAVETATQKWLTASVALKRNQAAAALARLDEIPLPLPQDVATEVLATRVQTLFALGRPALAINTALEREALLKSTAQQQQNHQLIWKGLTQSIKEGREITSPAGASAMASGWLELARLYAASRNDPFEFSRGLQEWRKRFAQHPGNEVLQITAAAPSGAASRSGQRLALLLPLSGRAQAAGIAVRDGFMSALLQQPAETRPELRIYDTAEVSALASYQQALREGATMVAGPLLKEDVQSLADSQAVAVSTLALNALPETITTPGLMFQFTLDPEDEARQAAERAVREGHTKAIVLTPNNEWGQRMQRAFTRALQNQGGSVTQTQSYDPAAKDHVAWVRQLFVGKRSSKAALDAALKVPGKDEMDIRGDFDFIFLAAQVAQGRQVRPALRFVMSDSRIPVYSTSDIYDPEADANMDLEGLRFCDMPWSINRTPSMDSLHTTLLRYWNSSMRSRSRLYAFGIDAYAALDLLGATRPEFSAPLQGTTGLLAVDSVGRIHRQLEWAQISRGAPRLLPEPGMTQ